MVKNTATAAMKIMVHGPQRSRSISDATSRILSNICFALSPYAYG